MRDLLVTLTTLLVAIMRRDMNIVYSLPTVPEDRARRGEGVLGAVAAECRGQSPRWGGLGLWGEAPRSWSISTFGVMVKAFS